MTGYRVVSALIAAALLGMAPQAFASGGGPGALASCQTLHPSGAPISITFSGILDRTHQTLTAVTISASFGGATYGPFTLTDTFNFPTANAMDVGCFIFSSPLPATDGDPTTSLSDEIVAAFGKKGTLEFTTCSFLGAASPDCTLKMPPGTIHTPVGLTLTPTDPGLVVGQITGYVSQH